MHLILYTSYFKIKLLILCTGATPAISPYDESQALQLESSLSMQKTLLLNVQLSETRRGGRGDNLLITMNNGTPSIGLNNHKHRVLS